MSGEFHSTKELDRLLMDLVDGKLDAEQRARLNELVRNPQAREYYVQYMRVHAMLDFHHGSVPMLEIPIDQTNAEVQHVHRAPFPWIPSIAAALVVALIVGSAFLHSTLFPAPREPIAIVLNMEGVDWAFEEDTHAENGLARGRQTLASGIVRVKMKGGTILALQGPVEFELVDANQVYLKRGYIRVRCPVESSGFTVVAADFQIVDLGTEFGVGVDKHDEVDVEVFEGRVLVGKSHQMTTGESGHIDRDGQIGKAHLKANIFPPIDNAPPKVPKDKIVPPDKKAKKKK
jgi:hypothetical protein